MRTPQEQIKAFTKVDKVIESCETAKHLHTCKVLISNYEKEYGKSHELYQLLRWKRKRLGVEKHEMN